MKTAFQLFLILFILTVFSCSRQGDGKSSSGKLQGLHKYYYPEGQLYLEINYRDSLPHGTFKQYFKSGKLFEVSQYEKGLRHGLSKKYHDNGQLSSETFYDQGRIHGIQKKFRKDGKLAFEAPYYYDKPCAGLKEYYISGNPVKNYPTIIVKAKDELLRENRYFLNISLSDNSTAVEFYRGKLNDGGYIGNDAMEIPTTKGIGQLYYVLPPGAFLMEQLDIIAKCKTDLNNYYITQLTYNLAAENR